MCLLSGPQALTGSWIPSWTRAVGKDLLLLLKWCPDCKAPIFLTCTCPSMLTKQLVKNSVLLPQGHSPSSDLPWRIERLCSTAVLCVRQKVNWNLISQLHTFTTGHTMLWAFTSWARNFPWKTKYFLIFCSQFSYTWTSEYKGETPSSLDAACFYPWYFPAQAIQLTSCDSNSQFPSPQFHCQHCPVPAYMEVSEVATSLDVAHQFKHSDRAIPVIPAAMCIWKVIAALHWVQLST